MLYLIGIASAIILAFAYMLFDIFNNRNVPEWFAYGTLAYAFIIAMFGGSIIAVGESILAAVAVLGFGYVVYRIGELGAADVIELAALSLLVFSQPAPLILASAPQLGMPLIVSLLFNTGIVAIVIVPLYYIPRAARQLGTEKVKRLVTKRHVFRALTIMAAYAAFLVFLVYYVHIGLYASVIVLAVMAGSVLMFLFETAITYTMVDEVSVAKFEEGDIIAFNLMTDAAVHSAKKKIKLFDRLVTRELIHEMRSKKIKDKFPVYKRAVPLALPIFIALVVAVLFGNLMLVVLLK